MIIFKTIRYQNILSTGNVFTEIDLQRSASTLIVGENGAGKSTMIDAFVFALYGRPFRDINKPQLVNSITGKNLLVELEFAIGPKEYKVRRGIKPNIFEIIIDGTLVDQTRIGDYQDYLEKHIIKMNFKSCCQIVILGSASYVPFMQLKNDIRRKVVEDLLDIQVFSVMNSLLKTKIQFNKDSVTEVDYAIELCSQKIDMHNKHLEVLKSNNDDLVKQKNAKIDEHQLAMNALQLETDLLINEVEQLNQQVVDHGHMHRRKTKLVQMEATLEDKIRKLNKDIQFFHDHDNCPVCKQGIDHEFKITTVETRSSKVVEVKQALTILSDKIETTNARLQEIQALNEQIQKLNMDIQTNNQQISFFQRYIGDLIAEIQELEEQYSKIELESEDATKYQDEWQQHSKIKEQLSKEKAVLEVASQLLKDTGIKARIIRQYVPIMNKLINKYLAAMDFMCDFTLDEQFNETIKSRFRDDFTYSSFSEGEKLKINMSLMFTWRAIAKMRNSASTNLLILDEVFDGSADSATQEALSEILRSFSKDSNIFVISHRSADILGERFDDVIKFEKHGNFSKIIDQIV